MRAEIIAGLGSGRSGSRAELLRPLQTVGLILVLALASGCASLMPDSLSGGAKQRAHRAPPFRVVRADAPADYDALVAEFAQFDGDYPLAREAYERAAEKDPGSAFIHARLARLAWQLDDIEGAVLEGERAFELDPTDVGSRLFLGRLYRLRRDFDGLDRVLRDEAGRPLDADSGYALFRVALERGDLIEAENLAGQLAEEEPEQLRGTLALATVYEQKKDYDSAEAVVRRALDPFPDHFLLYMRLAQIERVRGDRPAEIAVYREVLQSHVGHYGVLQRLGQAQLDEKDVEGAIETFSEIVRRYPDEINPLRRLASIEFSAGRYEAAARRLEVVLEREPDQPELAFALGQIRRALDDFAGALVAFERIRPTDGNYTDARLQIASIYEAQGLMDEAIVEVDYLRVLRPGREIDFHAAGLRIENGDLEEGITLLEGLLDGSEADVEVFYQLGVQHGTHGNADEALYYMQRVLESDPNNASALNFIGYSWAERGENLEEAEQLIRRAIELSPEDGYITDSLGWVYYKMAETLLEEARKDDALRLLERAQEQLMQAAEMTGGDGVVLEHLGDVLLLRGDKSGALDYYEEAVKLEVRELEQPMLFEKVNQLRHDLNLKPASGSSVPRVGTP